MYVYFALFLILQGRVAIWVVTIDVQLLDALTHWYCCTNFADAILDHMIACSAVIMFYVLEQVFDKFYKRKLFFINNYNLFLFYKFTLCTQRSIIIFIIGYLSLIIGILNKILHIIRKQYKPLVAKLQPVLLV